MRFADAQGGWFLEQFPDKAQWVAFGVSGCHPGNNGFSRREDDILPGRNIVDQDVEYRGRPIDRPRSGPVEMHDINRGGGTPCGIRAGEIFQKQAVPGRRPLLFLAPQKNVRSDAFVSIVKNIN